MKFKTNHNVYAPIFEALAELLDKDYEIKYDNSDDALGISATVVHKKYKTHGIHISTYLGPNPEWKIGAYVNLPLSLVSLPYYRFTPKGEENGFPALTSNQISKIKDQIKSMNHDTIEYIKEMGEEIELGYIHISKDELKFYQDGGLNLSSLKNYGIDIDYKEFLLNSFKEMIDNYRLILTIVKADDPKVRDLTEDAVNLYFEEMLFQNVDEGLKAARRFTSDVIDKFTKDNKDVYIETVKEYFDLDKIDLEVDGQTIASFAKALDDDYIKDEIYAWAYKGTGDDQFLSAAAKELFLF